MTKKVKLKGGTKKSHGGYTLLRTGQFPKQRREVERYLTGARAGLVQDLGPTEDDLTTAQIILIDRVISKLGVVRCIEEYVKENTVMVGDNVAPSLKASYLAYNNSVRLDLEKLGIHTKKVGKALDVQGFIKDFDEKKTKKEAEKE